MGYEHDIFVSYRRDPEALIWIERFLKPIVRHRVRMELEREVQIYVHEIGEDQVHAGTAWPIELGEVIARSRILIALWSGDYLSSEWCQEELAIMLDRERQAKSRSIRNKYGLVIPIVAHDGETIPRRLAAAQQLNVAECFNSRMPNNGPLAELLVNRVATHAKGIANAIKAAPPWRASWPTRAAKKMLSTFQANQRSQRTLPRFS
jgi:hypothetical protein